MKNCGILVTHLGRHREREKYVGKMQVHSKLGLDRCTHGLYSGAAPLSHDTMIFMKSLGLVISEVQLSLIIVAIY